MRYDDWRELVFRDAVEAERVQAAIRQSRIDRGYCPRHPRERVSTGGGTPMFDGLCGACEAEMDYEAGARSMR